MKKIFIDTDLGGDCDDVGAIALLNICANKQKVEIIGMSHTTSSLYGPKCIDIINHYYGRYIEIGVTKRSHFLDDEKYNRFAEKMVNHFGSSLPDNDQLPEAYKLMRKKLSILNKKEKLTLVGIGQLNNFYELLNSTKDEFSELSGYELIKEKVEEVILMGGLFKDQHQDIIFEGMPYITEYNIVTDIKSAKYFIEHCPVQITFIDFLVGYQVKSFGHLVEENDLNHPVTFSYKLFSNGSRESWDPITVYYACFGKQDVFSLSERGVVLVDEYGHTTFHPQKNGLHQYVKLNVNEAEMAKLLNDLMISDRGELK